VGGETQPSNIWLHGKYVTVDEWKSSRKIKNSDSLYPAYVQPINLKPYGTLLKNCGHIWGELEKPTQDDCGMIYRKIMCSQNGMHDPSYRHIRCNEPGCPICYIKFVSRLADSVTERIQGFKTVWRQEQPYHLIFWPEPRSGRPYADCGEAFRDAKRLLKEMGVVAAVVWYHPYRIKKELKPHLRRYRRAHGLDGKIGFWKMAHDDVLRIGALENYIESGPHWHAIATGYLEHVVKYSKRMNAGYKKKRYLEKERQVHEVAYYISSHCCREAGKSSVRYYGDLSYRMLAREMVEEKIKNVVCQVCGAELEEHDCDENGVCIQKLKDKITEKIKYYLYWKRGQSRPEMVDGLQCCVTRFNSVNHTL